MCAASTPTPRFRSDAAPAARPLTSLPAPLSTNRVTSWTTRRTTAAPRRLRWRWLRTSDEDEDEAEEEEEAAPPTRVSEIMATLQEAVDAGTGGEALAELLPELTTEVAGIESAFKDIQAANVGLEDQAGALKDQFLRLTADFDNFKKRTIKEKQQLGETAKSKVFEAMLPALDNFDLAKTNLKPESEEGEKIMGQYQGLHDGLMTILGNQGLVAVDGVGAPFDPNFHEAISARRAGTGGRDHREFRKATMGEDTLVRASMVKVSVGPRRVVQSPGGAGHV